MKVLVIGSGGREHALCWKLSQSACVKTIFCAPGNAGTDTLAQRVPVEADQLDALLDFAKKEGIGLTLVGPEVPLCLGIVDKFKKAGLRIFGPDQKAAQLEGSKVFTKQLLLKYGIPTAKAGCFTSSDEARRFSREISCPQVIKADGLAAGKGVVIAADHDESDRAIAEIMDQKVFGQAGASVLVEEFLEGEEASLHLLVSGMDYRVLPSSQDHKRVGDNDSGPNTGGMGAYAPAPVLSEAVLLDAEERIVRPLLQAFEKEGIDYRGVLYAGLMITQQGAQVLEFNCRFGDPETQVLMPLIDEDLVDLCNAVIDGKLADVTMKQTGKKAVCVVMTAPGYPGSYPKGAVIGGLEKVAGAQDTAVFLAGAEKRGDVVVTNGGRVLGVTAWGEDLKLATDRAYEAVAQLSFEGAHYRRDIAAKAFARG